MAALGLALLLSAGACGDDEGETVGTTPSTPAASDGGHLPASAVAADLTVTVADGTGEEPMLWTLTCAPAGGERPDPAAACAALTAIVASGQDPFAAPPADQACTEQYGGPQTATVAGTVDGEPVQAALRRTNGCEIARWDVLGPLLTGAELGG